MVWAAEYEAKQCLSEQMCIRDSNNTGYQGNRAYPQTNNKNNNNINNNNNTVQNNPNNNRPNNGYQGNRNFYYPNPVSYTHLDVYKRQIYEILDHRWRYNQTLQHKKQKNILYRMANVRRKREEFSTTFLLKI